jgi:hypothetical protein
MTSAENIPTQNQDFSFSQIRNSVSVLTALQVKIRYNFDFH